MTEVNVDPRLDETLSLIASDKVEGTAVKRPDGAHLGQIRRLMIDKISGKVAYAVMTFGGILTLGEEFFPVPWEKLRFDPHLDAYVLDITAEQLRGLPQFTDESAYDVTRAEGRRVNEYFDIPFVF